MKAPKKPEGPRDEEKVNFMTFEDYNKDNKKVEDVDKDTIESDKTFTQVS